MPPPPTIRSLASELHLSAATVSEALRDSPRVKPETKVKVLEAARRAGYRPNPLVGSVMADLRRQQLQVSRGVIGALNSEEFANPRRARYHHAILEGATRRAEELGFRLEQFWVGEKRLSLKRLNTVLLTRGIQGAVVMPFEESQDWSEADWSRLSAVRLDYCLSHPVLHTICPDHHGSLLRSVDRLWERGYRRIGLYVRRASEARILFKWTAAFLGFHLTIPPDNRIPPLVFESPDREEFLRWFDAHQPDVIIGHHTDAIGWLADRGLRIPENIGFFNLNTTQDPYPAAGLDLLPRRLGAAAVESVVAQIQRTERGVPAHAKTITLEGAWVEGPTLRPALAASTPSTPRPFAA
jgi:LacI family transcriptional regulator